METTKTFSKNKIKNIKKGQPIKKQLKTKKKIDQKIQKKTKNKNRLLFFWGPNLSLFFSCYALAALQPPTINQDIHHKTATTRPPPEAPSPPDPLPVTKENGKKDED